jgi:peroxiredoxin
MTIAVGDQAPDFVLRDQHRQEVRLSDYRGKNVVLMFYPFAFSGICTPEVCAVRDRRAQFVNDDTQVIAVSTDSVHVQRAFAESQGVEYPLLSDFWPHGQVAQQYGVFDENVGVALRGTFIIDRDGTVRWSVVNGIGEGRDADDYLTALADLG